MKRMLLIALGMLLVGSMAVAAELGTSGNPYTMSVRDACELNGPDAQWLSQNFAPWTIGSTQVACGASGFYTTENWFGRIFLLQEDHYLYDNALVCKVAFGISAFTGGNGTTPPPPPAGDYTVEIVLYAIPNTVWPMPSMAVLMANEVGRYPVTITVNDIGAFVCATVCDVIVDPNMYNLVVAIDAPHGQDYHGAGLNVRFYPNANDLGASMDSYLAAASCGIIDPVSVSAIGFPTSQTVLNVGIDCDDCDPTPIEESSWGAVKSLYR